MRDSDLVDPPDGSGYMDRPCPVEWCKAKRRRRRPPMDKYDQTVRYTYGDCRDGLDDFGGLVHAGRLRAAVVEVPSE